MNPLGCHALVWAGDWSEASARYAIESTARVGFDFIEIAILDPEAVDTAMTKSLAVDVAHRIGASHLVGVLYSKLGKYAGPITPAGRAHVVESMSWLAKQAADAGLSLSLEVVNRYETNVVNTAVDMLALIDETGADIGVQLDSYHMNIEESDFVTPVEAVANRLRYLHIGESHRGYLGTGTIDFDALFGAVQSVGYTGPVTFESFSSAVVHPDLSNNLAVWRNLWDDSLDLAETAYSFMASRLTDH